jgi:hypothetical protein
MQQLVQFPGFGAHSVIEITPVPSRKFDDNKIAGRKEASTILDRLLILFTILHPKFSWPTKLQEVKI